VGFVSSLPAKANVLIVPRLADSLAGRMGLLGIGAVALDQDRTSLGPMLHAVPLRALWETQ